MSPTEAITHLAPKLTRRGTRRSWRQVAARWLRRHTGSVWYVGQHHVRLHGFTDVAIIERRAPRADGAFTQLRVDGQRITLEPLTQ